MIRLITGIEDGKAAYCKVTPKQMAQSVLVSGLQGKVECLDLGDEYKEMTAREQALVWDQIDKILPRLYKVLGGVK